MDKDYLIVVFDEEDKIGGVGHFRSPALDAYKAARARALIAACDKYQVYEMDRKSSNTITFSPLTARNKK